MEPKKIKDLKKWLDWIRENPSKALCYFAVLIVMVLILRPFFYGFFGEKGKQLANTKSHLNSSTQPKNQQAEEQIGDIHQTSTGDKNIQMATRGDNSPIIGKIEIKSEQTIDIDYEVSSLTEKDGKYQRSVIIRNNSSSAAYNVHFSIKSEKEIINAPHPWPQGGGAVQTNYSKIIGNTYEAEVMTIPPRRYIKNVLQSNTEFEIEKVTIY